MQNPKIELLSKRKTNYEMVFIKHSEDKQNKRHQRPQVRSRGQTWIQAQATEM